MLPSQPRHSQVTARRIVTVRFASGFFTVKYARSRSKPAQSILAAHAPHSGFRKAPRPLEHSSALAPTPLSETARTPSFIPALATSRPSQRFALGAQPSAFVTRAKLSLGFARSHRVPLTRAVPWLTLTPRRAGPRPRHTFIPCCPRLFRCAHSMRPRFPRYRSALTPRLAHSAPRPHARCAPNPRS